MENPKTVELIIGGDTCPINRTESLALARDSENLFNDILPIFQSSDLVVLNLECPVVRQQTPIVKGGPVLGADAEVLEVFKTSGVNGFNLANNHIMDHGESGLSTTLETCLQHGIFTFGAGKNLDEAKRIHVVDVKGIRIGFLGIAENEYSIASNKNAGANSIDTIDLYKQIPSSKDYCDYLFVFLHGGNEHYPYPSPMLKKLCRYLVDLGASAVFCQHSHIVGCFEEYHDSLIVYGQGNFLVDYPTKYSHFEEGLLLKFSISKDSLDYELIPVSQNDGKVALMTQEKQIGFLEQLEQRNKVVLDDDQLEEQWLKFCKSNRDLYMSILLGHNRYLNYINRKTHFVDTLYSKSSLRNMSNMVRCESHREILLTIGSKLLKDA